MIRIKSVSSLIISLLLFLFICVAANAAQHGDVDKDNRITAADARLALRASVGLETLDKALKPVSDVDNDGKISAADARLILRASVGLEKLNKHSYSKGVCTVCGAKDSNFQLTSKDIYQLSKKYTVELSAYSNGYISKGTGFFISADGNIVTNYHVIKGANKIEVLAPDGKTYAVTRVLSYNKNIDLAIVKINAKTTPAVINYSLPETGDTIYTLGSSNSLTDTFSSGMVSNARRTVKEFNPNVEYIQITAPVSHGNSGGPLINSKGEVIGINTWCFTDGQNLNFAIPSKYIKQLSLKNPIEISKFGNYDKNLSLNTLKNYIKENGKKDSSGDGCYLTDVVYAEDNVYFFWVYYYYKTATISFDISFDSLTDYSGYYYTLEYDESSDFHSVMGSFFYNDGDNDNMSCYIKASEFSSDEQILYDFQSTSPVMNDALLDLTGSVTLYLLRKVDSMLTKSGCGVTLYDLGFENF